MTYNNLFVFLPVIFTSFLLGHASTLTAESIMNGRPIEEDNYKYQAAIFATKSRDITSHLRCNGIAVAPNWILSIAHCFMLRSEVLRDFIYIAIMGSIDITDVNASGFFQNIVSIYTYYYNASNRYNDIAMAKTNNSLKLGEALALIGLWTADQTFLNKEGVVTGYGCSEYARRLDVDGNEYFVRIADLKLRYAQVKVMKSSKCSEEFLPYVSIDSKFCGVTAHIEGKYTGTCWNDAGSPLIILDKVVGLVSTGYPNCNDTNHGSLYTNLSDYHYFINNLISNTPMDGVIAYQVRID